MPPLSAQYAAPATSDARRGTVALLYDLLNRSAGLTVSELLGFLAMAGWLLARPAGRRAPDTAGPNSPLNLTKTSSAN